MSTLERIYRIDVMLQNRLAVSKAEFLKELDISNSQFKRDLDYMTDRLNAPIKRDKDRGGYYLDKSDPQYARYQLPGLWLSAQEIFAVLTLQNYLNDISPELLGRHLSPLTDRLGQLLAGKNFDEKDVRKKIRIVHLGSRARPLKTFEIVAYGLLSGYRLKVRHYSRGADSYSDREISPQRLVHYRENWYLDAWCHKSEDLRTFAVDAIETVELGRKKVRRIPAKTIDQRVTGGYGIFSGEELKTAVLRFNPFRSRWVKFEQWHPDQQSELEEDGSLILRIPYSLPHELAMDVLRYGPHVEVLAPAEFRNYVSEQLSAANSLYQKEN